MVRNKIWKSKAYKNTKVDFIKSQMSINKILLQNGIKDVQHTQMADKSQIVFMKELKVDSKSMKIGVKISLPDVTDKNKNQLYRALFYYLKAKFESLTFGFVEEYNEAFVKEFMPYLVTNKQGNSISDFILPKLNKSLGFIKSGEQLYLDSPKDE